MYTHVLFMSVFMTSLLVSMHAWPRNRMEGWNFNPQGYESVDVEGDRAVRGQPIAAPLWFLQSGKTKRINVPGAWMMRTSRDIKPQEETPFVNEHRGEIFYLLCMDKK